MTHIDIHKDERMALYTEHSRLWDKSEDSGLTADEREQMDKCWKQYCDLVFTRVWAEIKEEGLDKK